MRREDLAVIGENALAAVVHCHHIHVPSRKVNVSVITFPRDQKVRAKLRSLIIQ
jgi:hypothetical protein